MSRTPGLFIVLEGGEGVGKTTQARRLADWMQSRGIPHTLAREPGGTRVGEAIRGVLLDQKELSMPSETELLLMLAARAAFVQEVVRPALEAGEVMLSDRFECSTFVYQGLGRGLGLDRVREMNTFATGGVTPDLTLVLDLPTQVALRRQAVAGKVADRIEGEGASFLERVGEGYRTLAAEDPRAVLVDAQGDPDQVQLRLQGLLTERFPEPFRPSQG